MFNHAVLTIELPRNSTPFAIRTLWASDGYAARIYLTSSVRPEAAFSITYASTNWCSAVRVKLQFFYDSSPIVPGDVFPLLDRCDS
jgi:hypothetical protein